MTLSLYFVAAESEEGMNLDLLVVDETSAGAIEQWQRHYGRHDDDLGDGEGEQPDKVFQVPTEGAPIMSHGVLDWGLDVPCVWEKP